MKVIQMRKAGGPEVLEPVERPLPEPSEGEIRVRAQAIGVSSADMLVRKGMYRWVRDVRAVPGNEMAGTVDALGPGVKEVRVGERVLVSSRELTSRGGCYAEAICVPASSIFPLPEGIAPRDAVSLPNYQLAGALLYESGVRKPHSIATYGASGGVGMALLQLAICDGLTAIGIVSSEAKRDFTRAAGVEHVLIRRRDDLQKAVMTVTAGRGVDVVYAMGGPSAEFTANLDLLAPSGTIVSFGALGGPMPDADIFGELRKSDRREKVSACAAIRSTRSTAIGSFAGSSCSARSNSWPRDACVRRLRPCWRSSRPHALTRSWKRARPSGRSSSCRDKNGDLSGSFSG